MEKLIYCKIIKFDHLKNSKCTKSNFSLLENIMYEEIVIFYFKGLLIFCYPNNRLWICADTIIRNIDEQYKL